MRDVPGRRLTLSSSRTNCPQGGVYSAAHLLLLPHAKQSQVQPGGGDTPNLRTSSLLLRPGLSLVHTQFSFLEYCILQEALSDHPRLAQGLRVTHLPKSLRGPAEPSGGRCVMTIGSPSSVRHSAVCVHQPEQSPQPPGKAASLCRQGV